MQESVLQSDTAVPWLDGHSEDNRNDVQATPGKKLIRDIKFDVVTEFCYIKVKYTENKIMKLRMKFGEKAAKKMQ